MLLDEKTEIKVTKKNIKHLHSVGYDCNLKDNIKIFTKDINSGSHIKVRVKCDFCGKEKEILFQKYHKNLNNSNYYACSSKCAQNKIKKTNLEKFGKEYYMQTEEYKKRVQITSIKNYGYNHFTQSDIIKNKIKKTNLEKFGSDSPLKNTDIKNKIKNTLLKKYGVDNSFKSSEIKDKMKKTFLTNYGVDWPSKSEFIKKKKEKSYLDKYGVSSILKLDWVREKAKDRYFEKYGVNFGNMTEDMILKMKENKNKKWIDRVLNDNKDLIYISTDYNSKIHKFKCSDGHVFEIPYVILVQRNSVKTTICTTCNPIEKNISGLEKQLLSFIKNNYNGEILENQKIIPPYEIDIYLPQLKLGFEFNGLWWHSEINKNSNYHLNKTELGDKLGIKLIHIYEDDWLLKGDIVKSRILNLLGKSNKIYARKCQVREINNNKLVRSFLEKNHIQGFVGSLIKIGLFYENELVSVMTFGKNRKFMSQKSEDGHFEMLRFCNKMNTNIIGGASKLFKYFIKNYNPIEVISYADRSWSKGDLYEKLGFIFLHKTPPNYYYIINGVRKHRFGFRKDKLIKDGFDKDKTEHQIMIERGLFRIYDSGSLKYVYVDENRIEKNTI